MQTDAPHCCMLHVASVCTPCWMLLRKVWNRSNFSANNSQHFLFRDRRSVAQQCWIRLHSSSNIVRATHAHYAWFTKSYRLYPSHYALRVPTLLGVVVTTPNIVGATMLGVVASVCTQSNYKMAAHSINILKVLYFCNIQRKFSVGYDGLRKLRERSVYN